MAKAVASARSHIITPEWTVEEIVSRFPATAGVFIRHHMHCVGCDVARFETVSEACQIYGEPLNAMLDELRASIADSLHRHKDGLADPVRRRVADTLKGGREACEALGTRVEYPRRD